MSLTYFLAGFFAKAVAGLDDIITETPLLDNIAKTDDAKFAFLIGTLIAISVTIVIASVFSGLIQTLPLYRYVMAAMLFGLATLIYYDVFVLEPKNRVKMIIETQDFSSDMFPKMIGAGFLATLSTVVSDVIVFMPMFFEGALGTFAVWGIFAATIIEVVLVLFFSEKITGMRYKNYFVSMGLILLGLMVVFKII